MPQSPQQDHTEDPQNPAGPEKVCSTKPGPRTAACSRATSSPGTAALALRGRSDPTGFKYAGARQFYKVIIQLQGWVSLQWLEVPTT